MTVSLIGARAYKPLVSASIACAQQCVCAAWYLCARAILAAAVAEEVIAVVTTQI